MDARYALPDGVAVKGSVFKRCGCTEVVDGKRKQLGARCPKLRRSDGTWNPRHGSWSFQLARTTRGGYDTQAEAQAALDAARDRIRRGVSMHETRVDEYLTEWLRSKLDIRRSTLRGYRIHIESHWIPGLGHLNLSQLRAGHIADVLAEVPGSDANRQRVRATLRSALGDAVRQGLVLVNAASLVKLPSGRRPKAQVWTDDRVQRWRDANEALERARRAEEPAARVAELEVAAQPPSPVMVWTPAQLGEYLDHAAADRLYAMWHLIAHRGLRRGEAVGLRWADVDLGAGIATIAVELVQDGWTVYEDDPKSEAGKRTIALDAGTVTALREHRRRQLAERLEWASAWVESSRVFTREDGSQLHPAYVTHRFGFLAEEIGLPPIRLHDLRHGAASLMLAAGVDMKVVQETLGHSMMSLTADTYTSVYPVVAAEAAEAAAALVPRKSGTGPEVHTSSSHRESARARMKQKPR